MLPAFTLLSFCFFSAFSHTTTNNEWATVYEDEQITFWMQAIPCNDSVNGEFLLKNIFAIENKTNTAIQVYWNVEALDNLGNVVLNDVDKNGFRTLYIPANERVNGDCSHPLLSTYVAFLDKPKIAHIVDTKVVRVSVQTLKQ